MQEYRLYFFDAAGHIFAREEFAAPDDATAIRAGCATGDASSDTHSGYAIWRKERELFNKEAHTPYLVRSASELSPSAQEIVQDMERRIVDSHWAISKSKRLLAALDELKQREEATSAAQGKRTVAAT